MGRTRKTKLNKPSVRRSITPLAKLEKVAILSAIKKAKGDRIFAAKCLGIGKTTLYRKLNEYKYRD